MDWSTVVPLALVGLYVCAVRGSVRIAKQTSVAERFGHRVYEDIDYAEVKMAEVRLTMEEKKECALFPLYVVGLTIAEVLGWAVVAWRQSDKPADDWL